MCKNLLLTVVRDFKELHVLLEVVLKTDKNCYCGQTELINLAAHLQSRRLQLRLRVLQRTAHKQLLPW